MNHPAISKLKFVVIGFGFAPLNARSDRSHSALQLSRGYELATLSSTRRIHILHTYVRLVYATYVLRGTIENHSLFESACITIILHRLVLYAIDSWPMRPLVSKASAISILDHDHISTQILIDITGAGGGPCLPTFKAPGLRIILIIQANLDYVGYVVCSGSCISKTI
jgi:hypothetical protein